MDEFISIIVPVYNVAPYLDSCVQSVLAQTYRNIEVLLVDDGSADQSGDICDKYAEEDNRIRVFHTENRGVSAARNLGIHMSSGQYIMFADSDDLIAPEMCEYMLKAAQKNRADIVMCGYFRKYKNKSIPNKYLKESKLFRDAACTQIINDVLVVERGIGFCWGKLFRAGMLVDYKLLFDPELSHAEDAEFILRVLEKSNIIYYLAKLLYSYQFNAVSAVRRFNRNYAQQYIASMQKIGQRACQNVTTEVQTRFYNFTLYHLLLIAVNYSFHALNPDPMREKFEELKKIANIPCFSTALKNVDYKLFSMSRAVPLFFMRHRLYFGVFLIAKFRHLQFKIRTE